MSVKQVTFRLPENIKKEFFKKLIEDDLKSQEFFEKIVYAYLNLDNDNFLDDSESLKTVIRSVTNNA